MNINQKEFMDKIRQNGFISQPLDLNYSKADNRVWSVLLSPGDKNILVFFHRNRKDFGDVGFDILTEKRNYYDVKPYNIYEAVDQILIGGKYDEQQ